MVIIGGCHTKHQFFYVSDLHNYYDFNHLYVAINNEQGPSISPPPYIGRLRACQSETDYSMYSAHTADITKYF